MGGHGDKAVDLRLVQKALREQLTARGHDVASDTVSSSHNVYIVGDNDLARALFHVDVDADEAAMTLYYSSGSWSANMPPRFAVLPTSEAQSPAMEMLDQMRVTPLFYEVGDDAVLFSELDRVLAENLGA